MKTKSDTASNRGTRTFLWAAAALLAVALVPVGQAGAQGMVTGDFNGDGILDLAIGIPQEDITTGGVVKADAGAVQVLYGSPGGGLSPTAVTADQFLHEDFADAEGECEKGDLFGYALAAGDFDNDGYDDLAVGVPGQRVDGQARAGAVHIFYGGRTGLVTLLLRGATVDDQVWHRNSPGVQEAAAADDQFGFSLAAGDFNSDGYQDLAIGVPYDDPSQTDAGSVHILYGSAAGIVSDDDPMTAVNEDDQVWHQDLGSVPNVAEPYDWFGFSLAAGDFNGDGCSDLAVGVPGESVGPGIDPAWNAGPADAGAVVVLYCRNNRLSDYASQAWYQGTAALVGLEGTAEEGDFFGYSLAAGDFNGDGKDDLAIGVPGEDLEGGLAIKADAGAVNIVYAGPGRLWFGGAQFWHQDSANAEGAVEDAAEPGDSFGLSLAAGDLDNDGVDDLVVGVPFEDIVNASGVNVADAGMVAVFYGRDGDGLNTANDEVWHQDSKGVLDVAESGDVFGMSVAVGDFNGDGTGDLAIGVPGESIKTSLLSAAHAGAVNVLHGKGNAGLVADNDRGTRFVNEEDQFWHQDVLNVDDSIEAHDHFGGGWTH